MLQATAAVFVQRRRTGSAVLVDDRHVITARHVPTRLDPDTGRKVPVQRVELEFPTAALKSTSRWSASRVDLGSGSNRVDVAVLELVDPIHGLPRPVPIWPAGRLPQRVEVFGYPLAEGALSGVWREFAVSGPTATGAVQLNWTADAGTFPGHSGGPVVDLDTGALVGILVEGAEAGRFDRFVPVAEIAQVWPGLPRSWLMAGLEGHSHFTRRARGQRSGVRGGDLFRGRQAALAVVRDWLTAPEPPELPLVITGQPGAGKSAVLARAVLGLQAERVGPGLAFHGRGATHADLLNAVADLTGVERVDSRDELLDALADTTPDEPWRIAWDALDEAGTAQDRPQIAETLTELAVLPTIRVAVATRPLTGSDRERYLPGGLLATLGVAAPDSTNLVDLDTDRYFDPAGLEEFASALLAQDGVDRPGPPGRAWTHYRMDMKLRDRAARVIARRAGRNYLVAAMAAVPLSVAQAAMDPAAPGFDERAIPSGVGEALSKYLEGLPEPDKARTRGLLTALAYARGTGIHDKLWLAFAAALGYPTEMLDLDRLRASTAADYLLQTVAETTAPATRLFHQALADELLARRHQPSDEHQLLHTLLAQVTACGGWGQAGQYACQYAAAHAADADELAGLLEDPHYLAVADFPRLLPLLPDGSSVSPPVVLLQQVGARATALPADRRGHLLALAAAHLGLRELECQLTAASAPPVKVQWAHSLGVPHRELIGHTGPITGVALGPAGGRDIIVSGSDDAMVRVWDAVSGQPIGDPLTGHTGPITGVALGPAGGRDIIVSGSSDAMVRLWDAVSGQPIGDPLTGHTGPITGVALGPAGGRDIIVSGSSDAMVRVWDAVSGQPIGDPLTGHTGPITGVALGPAGGRDIIVSGSSDAMVRVWDAVSRQPIGDPLTGHTDWVRAVALGPAGGRDIIVSGSSDAMVRVWDAVSRQPIGDPLTGHTDWVRAVALGPAGGRDIIVSGGHDTTVRVWDAVSRQPIGDPLTGHTDWVRAVALGPAGGRDIIVSGSDDTTVRVWDAVSRQPIGDPLTGHTDWVRAVALGPAGGRDIIVSGSDDTTVRVWDAVSGQPIGDPLTGHTDWVRAVALGPAADRDIIVSGSSDATVRVWDAVSRQPIGDPLTGHTGPITGVALGRIGGRDIIVSGSSDATVRVWDAVSRQPIGDPLTGHTDWVRAVALGRIGGRDIIVSGGHDTTVRVWDAVSRQPIGDPLTGHTDWVRAVALGRIGGRDIIVSGSSDTTVRMWDAVSRQPIGDPLTGHTHPVKAVALGRIDGRDIILSASADATARLWDAANGRCEMVLDLLGGATACAVGPGVLCVAVGLAVCMFGICQPE